ALALGGAVRGQGTPTAAATERLITVRETDRPPLRCRVLKTWTEPDGSRAMQAQAVDTGEVLTVVESTAGGAPTAADRVKGVATRIFHWGNSATAPAGVPVAPPQAVVVAEPQAPAVKPAA